MEPTRIVCGLGNPGPRYRATRHNLGFRVVERLADRHGAAFSTLADLGRLAWVAEIPSGAERVVLVKPRTYMNRSGRALLSACALYRVPVERLLVVLDDADLKLGRLRIRPAGRSGGHNGMRSILESFGTQAVPRVRLGVRGLTRGEEELADYVLAPFDRDEEADAERLVGTGAEAVECVIADGIEAAMNRFNAPDGSPAEATEEV